MAFSGKKGGNIGQNGGNLSYKIDVPEDGVYMMNIRFATAQRRWISVKVNEQMPTYVGFLQGSDSWGEKEDDFVAQRQVLVYLKRVRTTLLSASTPRQAKMQVSMAIPRLSTISPSTW